MLSYFFIFSAILFYIAKLIAKKPFFKVKVKRHFINTLINAMGAFQDDETVIRNACLTLIQFNVPDDMVRIGLLIHNETKQPWKDQKKE